MNRNQPVRPAGTDSNGKPLTSDVVRRDLEWSLYSSGSNNRWVVRDPVSLEYFYLSDTEKSAADLLDGSHNPGEILAGLHDRHPGCNWTGGELGSLVAKLRSSCLLMPLQPGHANYLWRQHQGAAQRGLLAPLLSPIAIRIPVFDPTRLLDWTSPIAALLFHKITVLFCLMAAAVMFVLSASTILPAIPDAGRLFQQFQGENAIWLIASFALVKSLHEFGHLLACRKWNSECHEVGILLLVFVPCLYCDTSDSWKLTSRGKRAAIAAAGIYVELILATLAAAAWMVLQPGLLQAIAMNVMLICTVGTILLNANPLLRYDGYYILTDVWGVPNLAEQSREVLQQGIVSLLTGQPMNRSRWDVHPAGLAVYGIAALIYRLFVVVVILYVCWNLLEPLGLGLVALGMILLVSAGLIYATFRSTSQILGGIFMQGSLRPVRLLVALALLSGCVWLAGFCRYTEFIRARGVASSGNLTPIFARLTGETTVLARAGDSVAKGTTIAEQTSPELELKSINLNSEIAIMNERVRALQLLSRSDPDALNSLNGLKEQLQKLENQREGLDAETKSLTFLAPHDGSIIEGNMRLVSALTEIPDRSRFESIWQERHRGMSVHRGDVLGWISDSNEPVLRAYVSGKDCERLQAGMKVRCRWDNQPFVIHPGSVAGISSDPVARTPGSLLGDSSFLSTRDETGAYAPIDPHYEVVIRLDQGPTLPLHNALVTAYFETGEITPASWFWRFVKMNLRPAN